MKVRTHCTSIYEEHVVDKASRSVNGFSPCQRLFLSTKSPTLLAVSTALLSPYQRLFSSNQRFFSSYQRFFSSYQRLFLPYKRTFLVVSTDSFHRINGSSHRNNGSSMSNVNKLSFKPPGFYIFQQRQGRRVAKLTVSTCTHQSHQLILSSPFVGFSPASVSQCCNGILAAQAKLLLEEAEKKRKADEAASHLLNVSFLLERSRFPGEKMSYLRCPRDRVRYKQSLLPRFSSENVKQELRR